MRYRKLPQTIRVRVQEFYEHRYRKKYFDEDTILDELSVGLREVCGSVHLELLCIFFYFRIS